jgi:hypothetical protein
MKLRILDNSIRLRLNQAEIKSLELNGKVESKVCFGLEPEEQLHYVVETSNSIQQINASFSKNQITVLLPRESAKEWVSSNKVGLQSEVKIRDNQTLKILVEKDFKCMTERPGEDESKCFPNPLDGQLI